MQLVLQGLVSAVALPVGVLALLLVTRGAAGVTSGIRRRRIAPIVVHPLNFEHGMRELLPSQSDRLIELPSRLRDFVSGDTALSPALAPGPISPVTPHLVSASPSTTSDSWIVRLFEVIFPVARAAFNVVLVPEVSQAKYSVGVQLVRSPGNTLVAARSFSAGGLTELVIRVGSFVVEAVLDEPPFLRRAPRWEQWTPGSYKYFRAGVNRERAGDRDGAHKAYSQAALRSPGNARLALLHGSLHESAGEYELAARTYNAANCLWRQNIELSYRLACAQVNDALNQKDAEKKIDLILSANEALTFARKRVHRRFIWRRLLRATLNLRRRDAGERRFWFGWLRPDPFRRPLRGLRRSKGHEYRQALDVAMDANRVELYLAGWRPTGAGNTHDHPRLCWSRVVKVVGQPRSGWLAHWSAACFFSRASELPPEHQAPAGEWQAEWRSIEVGLTRRGLQLSTDVDITAWKQYCEERAIAEIGRVLRNPCNQLNRSLLRVDPDMRRLRSAYKGEDVAVLAGLGAHGDESIFTTDLRSLIVGDDQESAEGARSNGSARYRGSFRRWVWLRR